MVPIDLLLRYMNAELYCHTVFGIGYYRSIGIDESEMTVLYSSWPGFSDFIEKGLSQQLLDQMFGDWSKELDNKREFHSDIEKIKKALKHCHRSLSKKLKSLSKLAAIREKRDLPPPLPGTTDYFQNLRHRIIIMIIIW